MRERLVDKNGPQYYVYHQADMNALYDIPNINMLQNDALKF